MSGLPKRGRRGRWIAAGLVVLIGAGAGLWWWASRDAGPVAAGLWAYGREDWDQALLLARRRLKESPDDQDALRLAARTIARQGRDQAAIASYSRLELSRMAAEDYFLLGRALSRTGQDDLALKSLEAARDADPDRPEMLDELAQVDYRKDRPAAAEVLARRLLREPGREARAQLMLGTFRAAQHDPAGAARALQRGFELDPDGRAAAPHSARPLRLLWVRSLLQSARPAEARRVLEAIPAWQSDPESQWLASRCFLQERDWPRATAALRAAGSYRRDAPLEPEPAPYVGAKKCAECHRDTYEAVRTSRHSTTFARARDARSLPLPYRPFPDPGNPAVQHRYERRDDGIHVETRVGDQVFRAVARYAFGSPDHYLTLTGLDEQGRSRLMRMSYYHSPRGAGWDISTGLPPHPSRPDQFLGEPADPGDGERRCLDCHTTNFRAIEDSTGPESADAAMGCERCHGPGGHHVLAVEGGFSRREIISPGRAPRETINRLCGYCHGITQAHGTDTAGESDDPGGFRFQGIRMQKSRCYTASGGQLHCVTCHDPHRNAETAAAPYEAKCLSCHGTGKTTCPVNPAKGCVGCHMPRAWWEPTHSFQSDHYIRIVSPRPAGS
jgi:tetratricopeptide (TPR) repeat protein